MSSLWEDFEINSVNYLNKNSGKFAKFMLQGGSDSTIPDIKVVTKSGITFFIEAKHSPAQCGQFVLLPNITTGEFIYSPQNANPINKHAAAIKNYMDAHFDYFKEAGTAGKDIIMHGSSEVFSNWIIETYKNKGVKYFISNNFILFHIDEFKYYFDVTAKYRVKRSGSSNVGKSNIPYVIKHIESKNYNINIVEEKGSKLFIESNLSLHNQRFILNGYEYMFSSRGSQYEIRKLSNTFNANVIFSIDLKTSRRGLSLDEFNKELI